MTLNLSNVLMKIEEAESKRSSALCSRFADQFEDDLLEYDNIPNDYFNFFIALLSERQYFEKPGIWNFILAVNNSRDALTSEQLEDIGNAFLANFQEYWDADLCLAVCDFVARNIQPSKAFELLQKLKQKEIAKPIEVQGIVDQGFFILNQEIKRAERHKEE